MSIATAAAVALSVVPFPSLATSAEPPAAPESPVPLEEPADFELPSVDLYDQFTSAARHEYHRGFGVAAGCRLVVEF